MLPLKHLTERAHELSSKQEELHRITSQLTQLISQQQNLANAKNSHARKNIDNVCEGIQDLKKFFIGFKDQIGKFGQYPLEIFGIIGSLPQMYENIIEAAELKWKRLLKAKDEQCEVLKLKIQLQEKQIETINRNLSNVSYQQNLQRIKPQEQLKNDQISIKIGNLFEDKVQDEDELVSSMEVTIKQYIDSQDTENFRKITELAEEEEEADKNQQKKQDLFNCKANGKLQNLFTFQNLIESLQLDKKMKSLYPCPNKKARKSLIETTVVKSIGNYEKFQPKILNKKGNLNNKSLTARAQSVNSNKNGSKKHNLDSQQFWKELKSHITGASKANGPDGKENQKENYVEEMDIDRQKKQVVRKMTDFRKFLCLDQGIKRFGLGMY